MTASLTHWLPYIGFWALVTVGLAVFAFYVYAALPLFRRAPAVSVPQAERVPLPAAIDAGGEPEPRSANAPSGRSSAARLASRKAAIAMPS
jgi:hypothetical protein